ncbi:glycosyltransferase family 2 protein [bacterium]|nr:glycosyltransferase family 2 protein [bacterium]
MALIEVIIPTFNRAHTLVRAIESVLSQSFKDFSITLVDDGSSDNTKELVQRFLNLPNFKYFETKNLGVSHARNFGAKKTSAKYLAFLDSDDEWFKDKLRLQLEYLKVYPSFKMIYADERWIRNGVRVNQKKKHQKLGGDIFKNSLKICLIGTSSVLIEKDMFFSYGGFREDFLVCEDYDLWLKITCENQVAFIEDELVFKYGGHSDQLSTKFKAMDYFRCKSMFELFKSGCLSSSQKGEVYLEFEHKYKILRLGFKKHQRVKELCDIDEWFSRFNKS